MYNFGEERTFNFASLCQKCQNYEAEETVDLKMLISTLPYF